VGPKIVLNDAFKGYTLDLDKSVAPNETIRVFKERLKQINLDILRDTIRIDNGRLDIPVFFSICGRDAEDRIGTKKQMGKGATPKQSEASAIMELAERFSFFSFAKDADNFFVERYDNLNGDAIPFHYITQSVHDASGDEIVRKIFSKIPMRWTRGYNLTLDKEVLVPFDWFYAINQFNGPSAGNCVEEAIIQGICEVVERHVSSLVSRRRIETPGIDPSSVSDPLVGQLMDRFLKAGIELFINDLSLDTGIPSVGVVAYDPTTFPERSEIVWTAGTTPNPQKALSRALTEVAQLAGDFNTASNYVASGLPKLKDLSEGDFIINPAKTIPIGELPDLSNDNFRIEVENCVDALSRIGMDIILIDVTHPQLQIPAFYTIIPGAHFRERAVGTSVGMFTAKLIAETGDPPWAIENLLNMDRLLPGKYYVKFFLGVCHLSINRPSEALRYLEEALQLGPEVQDMPSIYSYMGVSLKELERYDEAIETLRQAERYDAERTDIFNLLGFCYFKKKKHREAIDCFRKVLSLDPTSAIDYANIASNYRDLGDKEKAIRYYRCALELDSSIEFARENLRKLESGAQPTAVRRAKRGLDEYMA
jgi:ribosomal protein S12 methylthiotransferase accessory factor